MKKLSNSEAELKKSVAYKKACSCEEDILGVIKDNDPKF